MKDVGTEKEGKTSNKTIVEIKDLYPQYLEAETQKTICRFTNCKIYWEHSNLWYLYKLEYIEKRKQLSNKCQFVSINISGPQERNQNKEA